MNEYFIACRDGSSGSCHYFDMQFKKKYNFKMKTSKVYAKACKKGELQSCLNLALLYDNANEVKKNKNRARELFLKACEVNSSFGCYYLGKFYYCGYGISQDADTAIHYYTKACNLGNYERATI